ncbi:hypothetical protein [Pseudomonas vancouverensis]|uniref:Uncharacterized protein n=1 Tax=Pseudomonas vancouverensis TaxID=95300 RepID=A0A4R4KSH2_PSEVA|nr:hypothetical protein [Pseudomonas vancouverensis]KAB0489655.1 hypothetical protein F7R09_28450 [Pseudomonas vancouverensis]TDB69301.1 hypothetical protein EIY72_00155 [Pseudomonas vancouverensis]
MSNSSMDSKKYRWWFAGIFAVSLLVFLAGQVWEFAAPSIQSAPPSHGNNQPSDGISALNLVSIASLATSIASFFGFLITTRIAWRKERREGEFADLDLERKKLELESLRLDMEKKRKEASSRTGGPDISP